MAGSESSSFAASLPSYLQIGTRLRVYHVSTPATLHEPVFASLPKQPAELTTCESHFLAITQISDRGSELTAPSPEILVLGIEVLIFATPSLTTIFVSKADSTGFLVRPSSTFNTAQPAGTRHNTTSGSSTVENSGLGLHLGPDQPSDTNTKPSNSTAQAVITAFLVFLVKAQLNQNVKSRLVLSLFARSQSQYLFPGSVENASKHVLDDRQLIKWWCKVLDPLLKLDPSSRISKSVIDAPEPVSSQNDSHEVQHGHLSETRLTALTCATAYIVVPGCDRSEIWRSFLPAAVKLSAPSTLPDSKSRWRVSFPVDELRPQRAVAVTASAVASADGVVQSDRADLASSNLTWMDLPVQCLIPRLPDDPKARFCDDLDASVNVEGRWTGVKTLEEFWELMGYRQECSAGRVVGFIWLVFGSHAKDSGEMRRGGHPQTDQDDTKSTTPAMPPALVPLEKVTGEQEASIPTHERAVHKVAEITESPSNASENITGHTIDTTHDIPSSQNPPDLSPLSATRTGSILLTKEDYETFSAHLINDLDFAGVEKAIESTTSWITKLRDLSGQHEIGLNVDGLATLTSSMFKRDSETVHTSGSGTVSTDVQPQVNVLTAMRKKKRKAVELEADK